MVGIAGGSASGKTHVARQIIRHLGNIPSVTILSQDSFYKPHTEEELALAHASLFDFDHPDAIDMPMFSACLADLKACKQSNIPIYSFAEHQRLDETQYIYGPSVILTEGILALSDPNLRDLYDLKIFVQCDSDLMLARRIKRDVAERGRSVEGILDQYLRYVKPSYDNFVRPTATHADVIVPGSNNAVAVDLICTHVRRQLDERSNAFRKTMAIPKSGLSVEDLDDSRMIVLQQTPQLQGIFTILRSTTASKQDFVFFVDRLATLLMENAVNCLPHIAKSVVTPTGSTSTGKAVDAPFVCGVSILRSGGALERGFRRVMHNVPVGSLLVQTDGKTSEPLLLQVMLPQCVRERHKAERSWVFLLDGQIGTGASAFMAIRVLLDHGVKQEHIVFVTMLVAAGQGIQVLRRAFPLVTFLCGAVDENLEEHTIDGRIVWITSPGMGMIGDRYYL